MILCRLEELTCGAQEQSALKKIHWQSAEPTSDQPSGTMKGENQSLVTDEPIYFEK